jgi:hypothetical protein
MGEIEGKSEGGYQGSIPVNTNAGLVHVEWVPQSPVTPLGQRPFFIDFLKTAD